MHTLKTLTIVQLLQEISYKNTFFEALTCFLLTSTPDNSTETVGVTIVCLTVDWNWSLGCFSSQSSTGDKISGHTRITALSIFIFYFSILCSNYLDLLTAVKKLKVADKLIIETSQRPA